MPLSPTDGTRNVPGSGPVASDAEPACGSPRIYAAGHGKRLTRTRSRRRWAGDHDTGESRRRTTGSVLGSSLIITRARARNSRPPPTLPRPSGFGQGTPASSACRARHPGEYVQRPPGAPSGAPWGCAGRRGQALDGGDNAVPEGRPVPGRFGVQGEPEGAGRGPGGGEDHDRGEPGRPGEGRRCRKARLARAGAIAAISGVPCGTSARAGCPRRRSGRTRPSAASGRGASSRKSRCSGPRSRAAESSGMQFVV